MEWHHLNPLSQKKARTFPLAAMVMDTVFWDPERWILMGFMERGKTIIASRYVQTGLPFHRAFRDKLPGRKIIFQHDKQVEWANEYIEQFQYGHFYILF